MGDPNHLVTVGEEGFWSAASPNEYANPTSWGKDMGQDFKLNHMPKDIDFATIHIWPDTWKRPEESFQRSWILTHMREAEEELGKPLVLEEFGKSIESYEDGIEARNQVYRSAHELIEESVRDDKALRGRCSGTGSPISCVSLVHMKWIPMTPRSPSSKSTRRG